MFKKIIILIIALVCLLSVSTISATDTNNTDNSVVAVADAGTFAVLQEKINTATSGSTIYLENNYTQTGSSVITINKDLTIDGKGYTIDAQGKSRIFYINNGVTVTLKNITLINGNANQGSAIYVTGNSKLIVNSSSFTNNYASDAGGAIYITSNVKLQVHNSNFTKNSAYWNGGAIFINNNYNGNITDCNFINNSAIFGGGIYAGLYTSGLLNVTGSNFINNSGAHGGAIFSRISLVINNSTFRNNNANETGGAIRAYDNGKSVKVINSNFISNTAKQYGGSIDNDGDGVTVIDSKFKDCQAPDGGLDIYSTRGNVNLISNDYDGKTRYNSTEVVGNVVNYIVSGTFEDIQYRIDNTPVNGVLILPNKKYTAIANDATITVNKNIVINGQGSILDADKRFRIMNIANGVTVTLNNITFINGKVTDTGGAIYSMGNVTVTNSTFKDITSQVYGGAISGVGGGVTVTGSTFINTTADRDGGAIFTNNDCILTVTNSTFKDTTSGWSGGAIFINVGNGTVIDSNFINTIAKHYGGAIEIYSGILNVMDSNFINTTSEMDGGAILSRVGVNVTNSNFINTKANNTGGAIYGTSGANVINSSFTNTAAINGGAIYTGDGTVTVTNSSFTNNSAKGNGSSIYSSNVLNVKDSTFNSLNANGTAIIYIKSSNNNVNLTNNTIESNLLAIYNNGGNIISPTSLMFQNVTANIFDETNLTAVLTDDKGNIIGSSSNVNGVVNGTDVEFVFNNNTNKFIGAYTPQAKGNYTISGNYISASNINVTNGTLTVNTIPIDDFKIDVNSNVYCNFSGNITILPVNATGNVTIKVNGTKYGQLELSDGKTNWLFTNVTPGNYNVTFEYSGDDYYSANSTSIIVDIGKATSDLKANITDHIYGENTTVKVNVTGVAGTDLSGNVTVKIDGAIWNGTVDSAGIGEVIISGLAAGNHSAFIEYSGNNNYTEANTTAIFYISKANASVVGSIANVTFGENVTVKINVTGVAGTDLSGNIAVIMALSKSLLILLINGVCFVPV